MKIKKILATVSAIAVTAAGLNVLPVKENSGTIKASAAMNINYAEALQKSLEQSKGPKGRKKVGTA